MLVLADLLARESDFVREFIASLNQEQEALKRGETEPLAAITRRKTELVEQLNAVERERHVLLQRAGHTGDREGMMAWIAGNPGERAAGERWGKLMELAAEARRINQLNGRLIAIRLHATNQALGVLTEQPQRTGLYGRDGLTTTRTGSRIIDAA